MIGDGARSRDQPNETVERQPFASGVSALRSLSIGEYSVMSALSEGDI